MKKKLLALALGIVTMGSVAIAQIPVSGVINGITVTGTVTNVNPNSTLTVGTMITVVAPSLGQTATFVVTTVPSTNPPGNISAAANAINNAFNAFNVLGALANGTNPRPFGSNAGEYSVNFVSTQEIPFDFGLSAVLGAGAIAAVKRARKNKKEQESQVA